MPLLTMKYVSLVSSLKLLIIMNKYKGLNTVQSGAASDEYQNAQMSLQNLPMLTFQIFII